MGQSETFAYNTDGTLASKTDFNGNTAVYAYDPVYKRLISVSYTDGTSESYTYEPISGRKLTATNENGTTTYEYYPVTGRLLRETVPAGQSVEYQWNANGDKTAEIRPGETLNYTYDALGRISTITRAGDSAVASYTYNSHGQEETFTDFMGNVKTNAFDSLGRLTDTYTVNMNGTYLGQFSYTLDAAGRRVKIREGLKETVYTYDELNRLITETVTETDTVIFEAVYTYDPAGNRLTKTTLTDTISYTYDANDRMISDGMNTYTYDNNGNTLSDETVAAGYGSQADTKTYTYDSKNRLTKKNICIYCDLPLRSLLRSQPDTEMTLQ